MIWTPSRDAQLASLIRAGSTLDRIAAVMRTSHYQIDRRARLLDVHPAAKRPITLPRVKWIERPDP